MEEWVKMLITALVAVFTSSGFWAIVQMKMNRNNADSKLLLGLAHDRIIYLGEQYLKRGYITTDEFENLNDYLYEPYLLKGGNGSAKRIMEAVKRLPISSREQR